MPDLLCGDCYYIHFENIRKQKMQMPKHAPEEIVLTISEKNRAELNAQFSEKIHILKKCKDMIVRQANDLIATIESLVKEACEKLDRKMFLLICLARNESFTQEQASKIEYKMKRKFKLNCEFGEEISSVIVDCFNQSFLSEIGEKNKDICLIQKKRNEPGAVCLLGIDWSKLGTLDFSTSKIGANGVAKLIKVSWPYLKTVDLTSNSIVEAGAAHLIKANWPNLQTLNLKSNLIGDAGAAHFIKANWPNLQTLTFRENSIVDAYFFKMK
jgi:hypothetical protein